MKKNVNMTAKALRGEEEAVLRYRAQAGTGMDKRAGDEEQRERFSGWKQLASSFYRLYGRYPASAREESKGRETPAGGDGSRYPEGIFLQGKPLLGGGDRASPSRFTIDYGAGCDSVPLPRLQDHTLVAAVRRE